AASPHLRRSPSMWLPTGLAHPASELIPPEAGPRTAPGPHPPDLSRHLTYGASTTGSLALRLLASLAGPAPSGSPSTTRLFYGCSHPAQRPPGPGSRRL